MEQQFVVEDCLSWRKTYTHWEAQIIVIHFCILDVFVYIFVYWMKFKIRIKDPPSLIMRIVVYRSLQIQLRISLLTVHFVKNYKYVKWSVKSSVMIQDLHVTSEVSKTPLLWPVKNNASSINASSTILSNPHKFVLTSSWAVTGEGLVFSVIWLWIRWMGHMAIPKLFCLWIKTMSCSLWGY